MVAESKFVGQCNCWPLDISGGAYVVNLQLCKRTNWGSHQPTITHSAGVRSTVLPVLVA